MLTVCCDPSHAPRSTPRYASGPPLSHTDSIWLRYSPGSPTDDGNVGSSVVVRPLTTAPQPGSVVTSHDEPFHEMRLAQPPGTGMGPIQKSAPDVTSSDEPSSAVSRTVINGVPPSTKWLVLP